MALRLREAVRAVVIDGADRVLLVHFELPTGPLWAAPGGGIDPGESPEAAIRRELHEEVGLVDYDLGPVIWTRTHVFRVSEHHDGQREAFFLVRARDPGVRPGLDDDALRAENVTATRWWTLAELHAAQHARFAPRRLPELYEALLLEGVPSVPVDTGV